MVESGLMEVLPFVAAGGLVTLAPWRSLVSVTAFGGCEEKLRAALGVALPTPCRRMTVDGVMYLWSGPASWLVAGGNQADLAARAAGLASVTDQSDGRVVLQVHGTYAPDALAKLLPIDLHPSVFTPDATALTLAGHIAVQIWQTDDGAYELACFRSYAEALYEALTEAFA